MTKNQKIAAGSVLASGVFVALGLIFMAPVDRPQSEQGVPTAESAAVENHTVPVARTAEDVQLQTLVRQTDGSVLMDLLQDNDPRAYGTILSLPNQLELLKIDGKDVFQAEVIYGFRRAKNGVVALSASTRSGVPIGEAEIKSDSEGNQRLSHSPGEIWLIDRNGRAIRYETPGVSAGHVLPNSNASLLVFSGTPVDESGHAGRQRLYRLDTKSGHWSELPYPQAEEVHSHRHHYVIAPVAWKHEPEEIYAVEDYGETGGHMQLVEVRVN